MTTNLATGFRALKEHYYNKPGCDVTIHLFILPRPVNQNLNNKKVTVKPNLAPNVK